MECVRKSNIVASGIVPIKTVAFTDASKLFKINTKYKNVTGYIQIVTLAYGISNKGLKFCW